MSSAEKVNAQVVVVSAPLSSSPVNAPVLSISAGAPVAAVVSGLPVNTPLEAGMSVTPTTRAKATYVSIGKTRSNNAGQAKVPAFKASRAGTYTIQLSTAEGKVFYLKVKVAAKKAPSTSAKSSR